MITVVQGTEVNELTEQLSDGSFWQRTFDAVPDLIFILDDQHRIVRANRAAASRLGCSPDSMVGQRCSLLMHGTDEPLDACPHTCLLRDGQPRSLQLFEPSLCCHFDVSVTPLQNERGEVVGAVHVARDISRWKQIEQQLRRARDDFQQRHALTVAASLDGLWDWDLTADRVEYSSRWESLLGYDASEISPTVDFFRSILHPDDASAVDAAIKQHLLTREPFEMEYRLRHRDGQYRWFLARGQADWDEATGQATRMAGVIQDISQRKHLAAAREEIERFERLLSDISARFAGGLPADVDAEIGGAIAKIRQFFGVDQMALLTLGPQAIRVADPRHAAVADGVAAVPLESDATVLFPWIWRGVEKGEPMVVRDEDLPNEANADRETLSRYGVRSVVVVPLAYQNAAPNYALWLAAGNVARHWHDEVLVRLRLLGEIFVQTLLHRQADEELQQAELKYRTLAEHSSDWEYWQAADGSLRYLSPSCEAITGYPWQTLQDRPQLVQECVVPEDRVIWDQHQRTYHYGQRPGQLQLRIRRRDGQIVWLDHVCRPIHDASGMFLGTRVSARDVTEHKQTELKLKAALDQITLLKERLEKENVGLQDILHTERSAEEMIGQSVPLLIARRKAEQVAATNATVLLLGETGTGKELFARAIHQDSPRRDKPLVNVNCAALPSSLIESELFGHVKGAFTGALAERIGRFELADGGTLFLDEIGELDLDMQAKLLRVLQDGEFERIGGTRRINVDVRVVAATNRDLDAAMMNGEFRPDLYYRLAVFPLHLPPLRHRRDDIPLLVWGFIAKKQRTLGREILDVPNDVMEQLIAYDWPGNIRELQNIIERAMILSSGSTLVLGDTLAQRETQTPRTGRVTEPPIPDGQRERQQSHTVPDGRQTLTAADKSLDEVSRAHIVSVLDQCGWKIKGQGNAAERLGVKASTLRYRMNKLGIRRKEKPR